MANLNTYIYDQSLIGQYKTEAESKEAIFEILSMVSLLMDTQNVNVSVFYDRSALFQAMMTAELIFGVVLDRNRDLKLLWNFKRMQLLSSDIVNNVAYGDALAQRNVGLLCFSGAPFGEPCVALGNQDGKSVLNVKSWVSTDSLVSFLHDQHWIRTYSDATKYPPRDEQTILSDTSLFILTPLFNHKRHVYERIGKDEYWCCDNFHSGRSAELEVFRKSDLKHIGTCGIYDIRTFSTKGAVPGRVMDEK